MNEESAQSLISSLRSIPESKPTVEEKQQTQEEAKEAASEKEKETVVKEKEKMAADAEKEPSGEGKEVAVKEKEKAVVDVKKEVIEEKETPVDTGERCWKGVINGVDFTFVVSVPSRTTCRIAIRRKGSCKRFYSLQKNEVPFTAMFRNQSVSFSVDPNSKMGEVSSTARLVSTSVSPHV